MFPAAGRWVSGDSRDFAFVPPSIHTEMPRFIRVPSPRRGDASGVGGVEGQQCIVY